MAGDQIVKEHSNRRQVLLDTGDAQLLRRQVLSAVESLPWQWLRNDIAIPYLKVEQQVRVGDELKENRPLILIRGAMNPYVLMLWPLGLSFAAWV